MVESDIHDKGGEESVLEMSYSELAARWCVRSDKRKIFAIAGAPGSGKSHLAGMLERHSMDIKKRLVVLPMDGFHMDNVVLKERGLLAYKGSPQTFDVAGLHGLLSRCRKREKEIIAPVFDRDQDCAHAGALVISSCVEVVIVEGNYLLIEKQPWSSLFGFFDETVMVKVDREQLQARLMSRWLGYGFTQSVAQEKVQKNDLPNGDYIYRHSRRSDFVINMDHKNS